MTATIELTNRERVLLPYTLGTSSKLKKEIRFQKPWIDMIQDNAISILGWIQYNLHSIWAGQELYLVGNSKERFCKILEKNMRPTYDSAKRQGYEIWRK